MSLIHEWKRKRNFFFFFFGSFFSCWRGRGHVEMEQVVSTMKQKYKGNVTKICSGTLAIHRQPQGLQQSHQIKTVEFSPIRKSIKKCPIEQCHFSISKLLINHDRKRDLTKSSFFAQDISKTLMKIKFI